jgi:hypothetical protein
MKTTKPQSKSKLDSLHAKLRASGWKPGLTEESYRSIIASGLRGKNLAVAAVATEIACDDNPVTLRGLMYRVVSAGLLPSTDKEHYARLGRIMTTLREAGTVPFSWIVDNIRSTIKPSSWSGIGDYADTVRDCYRLDFWARLPEYVHVICEKDAIAGTLAPVTRQYDVALSPIRGYASLSFAHEIAATWNSIEKPIHAYYLGDFDASGFDLERDLRAKLERYCTHPFSWERLAVNADDFDAFNLIPLKPKKSDKRYAAFVRAHGSQCAELDAIPATELRARVQGAIERHVPQDEWDRLQEVERLEKETWHKAMSQIKRKAG